MPKAKRRKEEPELTVKLRPSTAKDLVRVLAQFSIHKAGLLQPGQADHASRLLALNLFRESVAEALREQKGK